MKQTSVSLGESLVHEGLLEPAQLKQIETEMRRAQEPFQKVLRRLRFIEEKKLISFLSVKFNIPQVEVTHQIVKPEVLKLIPENMVRKFTVIPLRKIGNQLTVVMSDPFNLNLLDQLVLKTNFEIQPVLATESEIRGAI